MERGVDSQQRRIAKEAADWNMRMLAPTSEREVEEFEAWLAADPAHAKAYAESDQIALMSQRLSPTMLSSTASGRSSAPYRPALALAATLILITVGTLWFTGNGPSSANAALANPGPAVRGVTFRDGTAAILDAGAMLSHDHDARSVAIEVGRVRFDAPSEGASLRVRTPHAVLVGSGSIFDVAVEDGATLLWVITGAVDVRIAEDKISTIRLVSGEAVAVRGARVQVQSSDAATRRWPAARVGFIDMPLSQIVAVANRRGNPAIVLGSPEIGTLNVTGVLDIRDARLLARKLAAALDLKVERHKGAIILTR